MTGKSLFIRNWGRFSIGSWFSRRFLRKIETELSRKEMHIVAHSPAATIRPWNRAKFGPVNGKLVGRRVRFCGCEDGLHLSYFELRPSRSNQRPQIQIS